LEIIFVCKFILAFEIMAGKIPKLMCTISSCPTTTKLPAFNKEDVEKEGWLNKTSKHVKLKRKRWMVLVKGDPGYLISFQREREYFKPTEVFEITENTVAEFGEDLRHFVLKTPEKRAAKRIFSCDSVRVAEEWVEEINGIIKCVSVAARRARILKSFKEMCKMENNGHDMRKKKDSGILGEDYLEVVCRETMVDWLTL